MKEEYIKNLYRISLVFLVVLSLFFVVKLLSEFKSYGMMGSSESNTITLSGHGEVQAVPDIANVYFTIRKEGTTVKEAQDAVAVVEKSSLDSLKSNGVEDKDIQAANASFNPKYKYVYDTRSLVPCTEFGCPPRSGNNVISGYEAYESITVKVRNTDSVGKIMQDLGTLGVTDLNGPNFTVDDADALQAEARKEAIEDARTKAEALAKDLGVRLGRIANFSEGGNYGGIYYAKDAMMESSAGNTAPAPAAIPKGENTITSDVTITYELR
ncbi:MAG TPA: SIMPL domain-containing protein [Candidatus Paceibacterota bacterium]